MRAVEQWEQIEAGLDPDWSEVQLSFAPEGPVSEAAAVLGPLQPGRVGDELRLHIQRAEGGVERARNVFSRVDRRRIWGTLSLVGTVHDVVPEAAATPVEAARTLAVQWDEALAALPPDWSDLYAELELDSSDWLERAALLMAPVNPARYGELGFRFRVARRFGYGASPEMTRRCLERVDNEHIRGELRILHVLSDTDPVQTQGPVWYVRGKVL